MPLKWYSSMKIFFGKIQTSFDVQNWLLMSEIGTFRSLDLECTKKLLSQESAIIDSIKLYSVIHNSIAPSKELWGKMTLGEVGMSLPWWCHALVFPPFLKFHNFFVMEKWPVAEEF